MNIRCFIFNKAVEFLGLTTASNGLVACTNSQNVMMTCADNDWMGVYFTCNINVAGTSTLASANIPSLSTCKVEVDSTNFEMYYCTTSGATTTKTTLLSPSQANFTNATLYDTNGTAVLATCNGSIATPSHCSDYTTVACTLQANELTANGATVCRLYGNPGIAISKSDNIYQLKYQSDPSQSTNNCLIGCITGVTCGNLTSDAVIFGSNCIWFTTT